MTVIRGTALSGYADLVRDLGGDGALLLRAAGIPPAAAGDPAVFIGYRNLITAVESGARATGITDFGRRLAERQGIEILGPVGAAAQSAPTVAAALAAVSHYLGVYSPALSITIEPAAAAEVLCRLDIVLARLPDHRQTSELTVAVAVRIARLLVGPSFRPQRVLLPHDAMSPAASYRASFGCPVVFASSCTGVCLRASDLDRPLAVEGGVHQVVRAYLDGVLGPDSGDGATAVRSLVLHLLPTGSADLTTVAHQLALHPRTLQRRLAEQGTCFEDVVEELRRELATSHLRDTQLSFAQVAGLLGYSAQSVLSRSSRRWFGCSPSEARRRLREPA